MTYYSYMLTLTIQKHASRKSHSHPRPTTHTTLPQQNTNAFSETQAEHKKGSQE